MARFILIATAYLRKTGLPSSLVARAGLILITGLALAVGLRSHPISDGGFPAAMAALLVLEALELVFALFG